MQDESKQLESAGDTSKAAQSTNEVFKFHKALFFSIACLGPDSELWTCGYHEFGQSAENS